MARGGRFAWGEKTPEAAGAGVSADPAIASHTLTRQYLSVG